MPTLCAQQGHFLNHLRISHSCGCLGNQVAFCPIVPRPFPPPCCLAAWPLFWPHGPLFTERAGCEQSHGLTRPDDAPVTGPRLPLPALTGLHSEPHFCPWETTIAASPCLPPCCLQGLLTKPSLHLNQPSLDRKTCSTLPCMELCNNFLLPRRQNCKPVP